MAVLWRFQFPANAFFFISPVVSMCLVWPDRKFSFCALHWPNHMFQYSSLQNQPPSSADCLDNDTCRYACSMRAPKRNFLNFARRLLAGSKQDSLHSLLAAKHFPVWSGVFQSNARFNGTSQISCALALSQHEHIRGAGAQAQNCGGHKSTCFLGRRLRDGTACTQIPASLASHVDSYKLCKNLWVDIVRNTTNAILGEEKRRSFESRNNLKIERNGRGGGESCARR